MFLYVVSVGDVGCSDHSHYDILAVDMVLQTTASQVFKFIFTDSTIFETLMSAIHAEGAMQFMLAKIQPVHHKSLHLQKFTCERITLHFIGSLKVVYIKARICISRVVIFADYKAAGLSWFCIFQHILST